MEDNVGAGGIGEGVYRVCGLRGERARVGANVAEVAAETRLEKGAGSGIKGLAGGAEDVMDDRRGEAGRGGGGCGALERAVVFFLAVVALAGGRAASTFALKLGSGVGTGNGRGIGHAQELIGHAIGFEFEGIAGGTDGEFPEERHAEGSERLLVGGFANRAQ